MDSMDIRMDELEIVEDEAEPDVDGNLPVAFDYITFEPIYDYSDARELYHGDHSYNREEPIGWVLDSNLGNAYEICEGCGRAVVCYESDDYRTTKPFLPNKKDRKIINAQPATRKSA